MPEVFSNREYADIHYVYGFCNGNAEAAVREYGTRFPTRRLPHKSVFARTHQNLTENGCFKVRKEVRLSNSSEQIRNYFRRHPRASIARASLNLRCDILWDIPVPEIYS